MYLLTLSASTNRKNKLEEAFFNYLKSIERMLLSDVEADATVKAILSTYNDSLTKEFPRCKPVKKRHTVAENNDDIIIYCDYVNIHLLKCIDGPSVCLINKKCHSWDLLDEKIAVYYETDEEGEFVNENALGDIGEAAAVAFGYM